MTRRKNFKSSISSRFRIKLSKRDLLKLSIAVIRCNFSIRWQLKLKTSHKTK